MCGQLPKAFLPQLNFPPQSHSHLAKVCAIAKDLTEECERLLHHATIPEVVRGADKILAQAQQYIRSEQDATPAVACSMEIDFDTEGELRDLVESFGELILGELRIGI